MTFDASAPGTSRSEWLGSDRLAALPEASLAAFTSLVVLAAHPDDETLGAGGTMARFAASGLDVLVVCVTDGGAGLEGEARGQVAGERADELRDALGSLGVRRPPALLGFADGRVREDRTAIVESLAGLLGECPADTLVLAPWIGDGHRDHRVLGEIGLEVADALGLALWQYPVWLWHWGSPAHPDVPWEQLVAVPLDADDRSRAQDARARFVSQIAPADGSLPMLHPRFLENFDRGADVFVA
ncbi:PIG-L deacetylase family protein [Frondihabitans peucedani]|uniref:PIG-L family deacetylase n=1 Tax=Frondihabitans peucedani TaxID=598626 RepID=A0ABP8E3Z2_9MICO